MKKYILMPVLAALSLSGSVAQAQDFDNKPVVNVSNSKENLELYDWRTFYDGRHTIIRFHSGEIGSCYYRCAHPYLYEL